MVRLTDSTFHLYFDLFWTIQSRPHGLHRVSASKPGLDCKDRTAVTSFFLMPALPVFSRTRCDGTRRFQGSEVGYVSISFLFSNSGYGGPYYSTYIRGSVILTSDNALYYFLWVADSSDRSYLVAPGEEESLLASPHHLEGLHPYSFGRWGIRVWEVYFRKESASRW